MLGDHEDAVSEPLQLIGGPYRGGWPPHFPASGVHLGRVLEDLLLFAFFLFAFLLLAGWRGTNIPSPMARDGADHSLWDFPVAGLSSNSR